MGIKEDVLVFSTCITPNKVQQNVETVMFSESLSLRPPSLNRLEILNRLTCNLSSQSIHKRCEMCAVSNWRSGAFTSNFFEVLLNIRAFDWFCLTHDYTCLILLASNFNYRSLPSVTILVTTLNLVIKHHQLINDLWK